MGHCILGVLKTFLPTSANLFCTETKKPGNTSFSGVEDHCNIWYADMESYLDLILACFDKSPQGNWRAFTVLMIPCSASDMSQDGCQSPRVCRTQVISERQISKWFSSSLMSLATIVSATVDTRKIFASGPKKMFGCTKMLRVCFFGTPGPCKKSPRKLQCCLAFFHIRSGIGERACLENLLHQLPP